MEIKIVDEGTPYVIAIVGRLDTTTAPQLESFAGEIYAKNIADIAVDMAECDFVSSAGLRVIVAMQKHAAAGGSLVFRNVQDEVMDVFSMIGFQRILTFE